MRGPACIVWAGLTPVSRKAEWQGMQCAMKVFNGNGDDPALEKSFRKEVYLLRNLNHINLVRFFGSCGQSPPEGQLAILMELMHGSLASLLYGDNSVAPNGAKVQMTDKRLFAIGKGIANGMNFLHKHNVCHRDLKSHNVLYDKQLNIKLCDFAFSKFKQQLEQKSIIFESRVGTPQWMAPEVLRGEDYSFSADLYSFGVIIWEMVHRVQPFAGMHQVPHPPTQTRTPCHTLPTAIPVPEPRAVNPGHASPASLTYETRRPDRWPSSARLARTICGSRLARSARRSSGR